MCWGIRFARQVDTRQPVRTAQIVLHALQESKHLPLLLSAALTPPPLPEHAEMDYFIEPATQRRNKPGATPYGVVQLQVVGAQAPHPSQPGADPTGAD